MTGKTTPLTADQKKAAERIRATWLRKKEQLGLTQERAAGSVGWSQGMFNHYIHGRKALNTEAVLRFATILDEDPVALAPEILEPFAEVFGSRAGVAEKRGSYSALKEDERRLLDCYRKLGASRKKAVMALIREMIED